MQREDAKCEACGASLPADHPVCTACGKDNTAHLADLGLAAVAAPQAARASPPAFAPPPRVPAPLKTARPPPGFAPVAGVVIAPKQKGGLFGRRKREEVPPAPVPGAVEIAYEDQMPSLFYLVVLLGSMIAFFGAFLYWNSSSPIIGPGWKTWALGIMIASGILGLIVAYRLGRKEELGRRSAEFARRRRQGAVQMVKGTARGVAAVGRGIRSGGIQFTTGFQEGKNPNFIIRFIRWVIRTIVRTINGFIALIRWLLRTFFFLYLFVVRLGWRLYRYIVEPVVILAWRILRWALKVTYRVARWALNVVWKVFYWLVRRWPFKHVTKHLEEPARYHVRPRVLTTNVVVSDFLGAPVRPAVRTAAAPHVLEFRTDQQAKKGVKLLEKQARHEHEAHLWYKIPTPEERRALRMEKARVKAEEEMLARQHKQAEKQAILDARKREKDERRRLKEEGRLDEVKAQKKAEKTTAKEAAKAEKEATKEAKHEEKGTAKERPVAAAASQQKLSRKDKKAQKEKEKIEAKEREKAAKKQAKKDKQDEKAAIKQAKKGKQEDEGETEPAPEPAST